jgi:hypothetical protein
VCEVGWLVGRLVGWLFGWFVGWLGGWFPLARFLLAVWCEFKSVAIQLGCCWYIIHAYLLYQPSNSYFDVFALCSDTPSPEPRFVASGNAEASLVAMRWLIRDVWESLHVMAMSNTLKRSILTLGYGYIVNGYLVIVICTKHFCFVIFENH